MLFFFCVVFFVNFGRTSYSWWFYCGAPFLHLTMMRDTVLHGKSDVLEILSYQEDVQKILQIQLTLVSLFSITKTCRVDFLYKLEDHLVLQVHLAIVFYIHNSCQICSFLLFKKFTLCSLYIVEHFCIRNGIPVSADLATAVSAIRSLNVRVLFIQERKKDHIHILALRLSSRRSEQVWTQLKSKLNPVFLPHHVL